MRLQTNRRCERWHTDEKLMSISNRKKTKQQSKQHSLETAVIIPAASGCGLGCLTVTVFGLVSLKLGFCFIWPHSIPQLSIIIFFCVLLTAVAFKMRMKNPPWVLFLTEVLVIAFLGVALSTWHAPKRIFKRSFLDPIPQSVVIHRGDYFQAGPDAMVWLHFSAPPNVMLSIIQTNNLTKVTTNQLQQEYRTPGFISGVPDWWTTNSLSSPTLYRCEHTGISRPWTIGMWVNSETNDAFGYVY
jgi:hypothetical protein